MLTDYSKGCLLLFVLNVIYSNRVLLIQALKRCVTTVTSYWVRWRLKSPASRLFTQPFIQAYIKENIKAPRRPLAFVQGIHRWPVNPPQKWTVTRKMFPFDDVIMSWSNMPVLSVKRFPQYWSFVMGIQWLWVDSPHHQEPVMQALVISLLLIYTSCWMKSSVAGDLKRHGALVTSLQCE